MRLRWVPQALHRSLHRLRVIFWETQCETIVLSVRRQIIQM